MKNQTREIPEFKSVDEELDFWDRHSALEFLDEESVVEVDASRARRKRAGSGPDKSDGLSV